MTHQDYLHTGLNNTEIHSPAKDLVFSWYDHKNEHYACRYGNGKQVRRVVFGHLSHKLLMGSSVHSKLRFRYTQS